MVEFVEDVAGVRRNLRTMRNYLLSTNDEERFFGRERLRRGYNLVAALVDGDVLFAPSRFVGYKNITIRAHKKLGQDNRLDGKETNPVLQRILGTQTLPDDPEWPKIEEMFLRLCEKIDVVPINRNRKFWVLDDLRPDQAKPAGTYSEGALSFYVSTRYERNPAARKACIDAHGTSCSVCGFNFEQSYGAHGKDFIHVHHLRPLYQARSGNRTDPTKDLVPVCPNCHYMLHRGNQLLTPEELKLIMKRK